MRLASEKRDQTFWNYLQITKSWTSEITGQPNASTWKPETTK